MDRVSGVSDYQRGNVKNIRTAEEATMIRGAVEGRMGVKAKTLTRCVKQVFDRTLEVMQWALQHPLDSTVDINELAADTVTGVPPVQLAQEIISESAKFRLLPFSPIMEDKASRRTTLSNLLPVLPPEWLAQVDAREAMKEIMDLYELRPSMLRRRRLLRLRLPRRKPPCPGCPGCPEWEKTCRACSRKARLPRSRECLWTPETAECLSVAGHLLGSWKPSQPCPVAANHPLLDGRQT